MKIAGLIMLRWAAEADAELQGMTCKRILQPGQSAGLVLHLTGRRERFVLLPDGQNVVAPCWTGELKEFAACLGEHRPTEKLNRLPRRRLMEVTSFSGDRRVAFHFAGRPDKEADEPVSLILHLMGTAPLFLLVDSANIVQETSRPSKRFLVAAGYAPPNPPVLINPLTMTFPEFQKAWRAEPHAKLDEFLHFRVWGIDQGLAGLLAGSPAATGLRPDSPDQQLWEVFTEVKAAIRKFLDLRYALTGNLERGEINPISLNRESSRISSINDLLCRQLGTHVSTRALGQIRETWRKFAAAQLGKLAVARGALAARQRAAEEAATFKRWADILNINRAALRKGLDHIELPDPYTDNQPVRINLDPATTIQENIEAYYKKHRRALSAKSALAKEASRLNEAEALLRQIAAQVAEENLDEASYPLDDWRKNLHDLGLSPPQQQPASRRTAPAPRLPYREFVLAGGEVVWIGRSARENDELTLKLAAKSDWFLHAAQNAGAHVILKHGQSSSAPSAQALRRAAAVAAFFSEAKHSSVVPVVVTAVKYVRKPRKAPPGMVALLQEETMLVAPAPPPGYHDRGDSS